MSPEISVFGIKTSRFVAFYGLAIGVAALIALYFFEGYLANVAFLVIGALLGTYPAFIIEEMRRTREAKNLAKSLFQELAKAVGRCCFDFESPWGPYLQKQGQMSVDWLRRFIPDPPVIYPALAPQIALLNDDEAQAIIDFYMAYAAWRREGLDTANEFQARRELEHGPIRTLARRLMYTLRPGRRALEALGKRVPGADEIERNCMKYWDELFAKQHPHAGKTVRERIDLALKDAPTPGGQ